MTGEEMKAALSNNDPVLYKTREGAEMEMRMFGIVYRSNGRGGIQVSAELLDKTGRSVILCKPQDIKKLSQK